MKIFNQKDNLIYEMPEDTLTGADLSGAKMTYANLSNANLSGADLSGAKIESTQIPTLLHALGIEIKKEEGK